MSDQFLLKLIQNYIELLNGNEYNDIRIQVGENPNVRIFRAHTNILCCRSPYLRKALTSNKNNDNKVLAYFMLPSISPEIFQIILK